jgi:hypothetical protein
MAAGSYPVQETTYRKKIDHAGCHNLKRNLEERKQREETKEEGEGSLAIERECSS